MTWLFSQITSNAAVVPPALDCYELLLIQQYGCEDNYELHAISKDSKELAKALKRPGKGVFGINRGRFDMELRWKDLQIQSTPVDVIVNFQCHLMPEGAAANALGELLTLRERYQVEDLAKELLSSKYDANSVIQSLLCQCGGPKDFPAQRLSCEEGFQKMFPGWLALDKINSLRATETQEYREAQEREKAAEEAHRKELKADERKAERELADAKKQLDRAKLEAEQARLNAEQARSNAEKAEARRREEEAKQQEAEAKLHQQECEQECERAKKAHLLSLDKMQQEAELKKLENEVARKKAELEKAKTLADQEKLQLEVSMVEKCLTPEFRQQLQEKIMAKMQERLCLTQCFKSDWIDRGYESMDMPGFPRDSRQAKFDQSIRFQGKRPQEAMRSLCEAAEQGHPAAQDEMGMRCLTEWKQDEVALEWFQKSAEQGFAVAQDHLGVWYWNKKQYAEAVPWFQKSAKQGYKYGMRDLGLCYYYGAGVKRDYQEAVKWFFPAAMKKDYKAATLLAECYAKGQGVPKDPEKSGLWKKSATEWKNKLTTGPVA